MKKINKLLLIVGMLVSSFTSAGITTIAEDTILKQEKDIVINIEQKLINDSQLVQVDVFVEHDVDTIIKKIEVEENEESVESDDASFEITKNGIYTIVVDYEKFGQLNTETRVIEINGIVEIEESEYLPFIFEGEDIPSKPPLDIANEITLTTSSANGAITEWMLKGDVTRDGVVNKDDVEAIQKHEASLKPILNSIELESADMNGDGYVDLEDAIQIEAVNNGVLLLPHASFTFRVVNTPNTGHEVTAVTVNGMNLTVPAKGTNVTTGAYTLTVDTMGVTTVEGIVQDYVNEVVFDNTPIVHNEITLTTSSTNGVITNWVLKGDVNRDGVVNRDDVDAIMASISGAAPITDPEMIEAGDVDGDGRLTASDANWIMRITTGLVVLPQPLFTVNVVNAPNVGYETSGVTINEVYYVAPAKGNSVTVDTYTITVDDNGNAAVEGIIQDYVNEIVFDNKVILPVVTPAPLPSTSTQTPEQGRTCQDDGYPAEYYWNGVACVIDTIVVVPPVVNQNPPRNQNGNEITSEEENFMPPVIDTVIETPKATVPEVEEKAEVVLPEETPLVKLGGWSLANLIITISSVILAILLLVMKKQKEETEDNATKYYQKNKYWIVLAVLCTILLIIVFFLTQDLRLPMIFVDNYTVIMVIIIIFNLPIYLLANQWKEVKSRT